MKHTVLLPVTSLPAITELAGSAAERLRRAVELDPAAAAALALGQRPLSWCPWPTATTEFFSPGASSRGCRLLVVSDASGRLRVTIERPPLGTWVDWCLGAHLGLLLLEAEGARADWPGAAAELSAHLDSVSRYHAERREAAAAVAEQVEERGEIVRFPGPLGTAAIGPLSWPRLLTEGPPDELDGRLVDALRASLEARGFGGYDEAAHLVLDGLNGRQIVASVLAPERPVLLRDPQYVLLSGDLEASAGAELLLVALADLDRALPLAIRWLDDVTCAVDAVDAEDWPTVVRAARPHAVRAETLLDTGGPRPHDPEAWRRFLPDHHPAYLPDPDAPAPPRPWWKIW